MIIKGLYKIVYQESKRRGITHLYMIVEETLFNSLRKFGFYITRIGEAVEYHGLRVPCLGILKETDLRLKKAYQDMFNFIYMDLEKEYHPKFD